jgi:TRAP-type C4-dicarboxylate transport system permease small subunit
VTAAARFSRAIRNTAGALQFVAGGTILIAAIGVTVNAIARYGFGRDVAFITEVGGFVFLYVIFLGLAGTFYAGGHVAVELLEALFSKTYADWARRRLIPWLSLAFALVLMVTGAIMTFRYFQTGRLTIGLVPMPFWIFMAVVPLGSLLLSLALIARIISPEREESER